MPDEDDTAKLKKLPASLVSWADGDDPDETRTVIFRIASDADPEGVSQELKKLKVNVTSAGTAVIVGAVPRRSLLRATEVPDVVRLEEPERLSPKDDQSQADFLSFKNTKKFRLPDN